MPKLEEMLKRAGRFELGLDEIDSLRNLNWKQVKHTNLKLPDLKNSDFTDILNLYAKYRIGFMEVSALFDKMYSRLSQNDVQGAMMDAALVLGSAEGLKIIANYLCKGTGYLMDKIENMYLKSKAQSGSDNSQKME